MEFSIADLETWSGGKWTVAPSVPVTGFCFDSRKIKAGDLFVAISSDKADGHDFLDAAFSGGAAAALIDKPERAGSYPCLVAGAVLPAFQKIALAYRKKINPAIIGVTGSVGKSTVKEWTAAFLSAAGKTACTVANFNNDIGLPYSLLSTIEEDTKYGVFEAGISHPGEMESLAATMAPHGVILTAIAPVHIEFFDSVRAIAFEKAKLFLSQSADDGFVVLDRRGEFYDLFASMTNRRIISVAVLDSGEEHFHAKGADYIAEISDEKEGAFSLFAPGLISPITVSVRRPGRHNVFNALLAIAAVRGFEISWDLIEQVLAGGLPVMHNRWEQFERGGFEWINDAYNASPVSMKASVRAFAMHTSGRGSRAFVLGDMFELGDKAPVYHKETAQIFDEIDTSERDFLICVGELAKNFASTSFKGNIIFVGTAEEAGEVIRTQFPKGGIILLKASRGMHLERVLPETP